MKAIDIVHLMAGLLIMTGIVLSLYVDTRWLILSGFVGLNLFQFSISKFCPMVWFLKRLGINE